MKVLMLSVAFGGGHTEAAKAIKESLLELNPNCEILITDAYKHSNPIINKIVVNSYLQSLKNKPELYKNLYDYSEYKDSPILSLSDKVNNLLSFRIEKLINEYKPNIIVCTQPLPLQIMALIKRRITLNIPVIGVFTDYASHPMWVHKEIDKYVISHNHMKYELIKLGIREDNIFNYGIPVKKDFLYSNNIDYIRQLYTLDNKKTFLLMGGSLGFGEIIETFDLLEKLDRDIQIIVISGNNKKVFEYVLKRQENTNKKIVLIDYSNNVFDLMDVSDYIITKPGGMTVTEAMIKNKPLVLTKPLPGQEERNFQFLINNGLATCLYNHANSDCYLYQIMDNTELINKMAFNGYKLVNHNSSNDIAKLIIKESVRNEINNL